MRDKIKIYKILDHENVIIDCYDDITYKSYDYSIIIFFFKSKF